MSESPKIGTLLRLLTVKVNSSIDNGSGILCKPAPDADFLYVLTARHIIANGSQIVPSTEISIESLETQPPVKYSLQATDRVLTFDEEEKDIAILIIPTAGVQGISGSLPVVSCVKDWFGLKECLFRGFPEANMGIEPTRIDGEIVEGQKHFDFQFEFFVPQSLEGRWNQRTENFLAYDNVGGFSGSGVFVLNDEEIYLLGVVSKFGPFNRFLGIKANLLSELLYQNELPEPAWIVPETRPEVRDGIKRLRENSNDVRKRIVTQVGGKWQVEKTDLQKEGFQKIQGNATFLLVSGAAGTGKSGFVEQLVQKYFEPRDWQILAFRGDQFCRDEASEVLRDLGIQTSMANLLQSPAFVGNLLIWIDGAEKLVETMKFEALLDLMRLVTGKMNIRLLLTLRKFSVQHFKIRLAGQTQFVLVDVPPLTDEELAAAAATFPHIQPLLQSPKLKRLLKLPFYLDQAVKLPEMQIDQRQELDEPGFQALVWKEHIEKHIPSRGRQFEEIVMRRARNLSSFELPESPDDGALKGLEADHIIVRETGGNQERFAPAHDIFEDWALMRHVQRCWDRRQTPESFITDLGGDYAIRRGFRFWLEENLNRDNATVTVSFLEKILNSSDSVAAFWKDEIMVSVLQSSRGSQFLQDHHDKLLEDQAAILGRFLRIYRTACKEPLTDGSGQVSSAEQWRLFSMNFRPVGPGWETLVRFIWENFDQISDKNLIANFLSDWGNQVEFFKPLPESAREAALCLLKLLEGWKAQYGYGAQDGHDRQIKECVRLLFRLTEVVKEELRELLETASRKVKHRDKVDGQNNKFYKLLLKTSLSYFFSQKFCLHFPDTVIAIADEHWKKSYTQNDIYYHNDFLDSCMEYGIARSDYIRYSPESALQTPLFWLLTFHPNKALNFLVELFNYAAQKYRKADFEYKKEVQEVVITMNDGRQVRQWGNSMHFAMYRGQGPGAPDVLKSCLMALEKWLLDIAGSKDEQSRELARAVFDSLLNRSESVAISGVLSSVAMARPEAIGDRILPLMTVREFIEWDFERWHKDSSPFAIGGLFEFDRIHQQDRIDANNLPHRKTRLMNHIIELCWHNPKIRERFETILDSFYQKLEPADLIWKKWLTEMDLRTWRAGQDFITEDGKTAFVVQPQFEADVSEMITQTQAQAQSESQIVGASMWGLKAFERETVENPSFEKWVECYAALKPIWENPHDVEGQSRFIHFFPAGLAAVGVRDYFESLNPEQKSWCVDVLLDRAKRSVLKESNINQMDLGHDRNPADDEPANFSLIELLRAEFDEPIRQEAANLLFECICVFQTGNNLLAPFFNHLRENLWAIAPEVGLDYWHGLLEFARWEKDWRDSKVDFRFQHGYEEPTDVQKREEFDRRLTDLEEKVLAGGFRATLTNISFETHSPWRLDVAFLIMPDNHRYSGFHDFTQRYLEILADKLSIQQEYGDNSSLFSHLNVNFQKRFAYYLLRQPAQQSDSVFQVFLAQAFQPHRNWHRNHGYEFFDRCFEELLFAADNLQDGKALQRLWQIFYQKLKNSEIRPYLKRLFWIIQGWKINDTHWKPIEGSEAFFKRAIFDFGAIEFNAVLQLLSGIGSKTLLPEGLEWAVAVLSEVKDEGWDIFEAEKLLQRLYYNHYPSIRKDRVMFENFMALLDRMILRDSSQAFFIRESCFNTTV